jgi:hypothetical protein
MAQKSGAEQFIERIKDMTKRVLTIIALITILNAPLFGQSPAPDSAPTRPRNVARLRKLKRRVLFSQAQGITVTLKDGSRLSGRVGEISEDGFSLLPQGVQRRVGGTKIEPASRNGDQPSQGKAVRYAEVESIRPSRQVGLDEPPVAFALGFVSGVLAPLGVALIPLFALGVIAD